jgi:hypothetical protein
MPSIGLGTPDPNHPNKWSVVTVREGTPAMVLADDVTYKLARELRCVAFMLPTGQIVLEDRERVSGWQSRVIWAPESIYLGETDDPTAATTDS